MFQAWGSGTLAFQDSSMIWDLNVIFFFQILHIVQSIVIDKHA